MRRWRVPLALTAVVLLAQLFRTTPLIDAARGAAPTTPVHLVYPVFHIVFAPFTLFADYLNGGSVSDLKAFAVYTILIYILVRLSRPTTRLRELKAAAVLVVAVGAFLWWGSRWKRPIARLVATDNSLIVFDTHSHTSASHDGRKGFGSAANAWWHRRAGFDAAFVTDHNVCCAAKEWQQDRGDLPPRLLSGEELSLSGLHMIVLGTDTAISNRPWNASFDSSLALLAQVRRTEPRAFVIASLPEYSRDHWGADLGRVIEAGTGGLEIWTTSPRAMEFPESRRREVAQRARSLGVALFGATDMHGLGYAATVWNVMPMPGWRALGDSALTAGLVEAFRARPADVQVVARRRVIGEGRLERAFALPLGVLVLIRSATPGHLAALVAWCWLPALLSARRRPRPTG